MTAIKRAFIVGGVAGGASCAARLRRLDEQVEIDSWTGGHTFPLRIAVCPITWAT
jgi:hypothetical protein